MHYVLEGPCTSVQVTGREPRKACIGQSFFIKKFTIFKGLCVVSPAIVGLLLFRIFFFSTLTPEFNFQMSAIKPSSSDTAF